MPDRPLARRALLAGAAAAFAVPGAAEARLRPGQGQEGLWRGIEFEDRDGRTFQFGSGTAPLTLVTLWAHWCPACLSEMPSLAALSATLGQQLDVLLLSHPEYWERDKAAALRQHIPHRLATLSPYNSRSVMDAVLLQDGAYAVPRSLVLRRDASIAWSRQGSFDWASADAVGRLRVLAQGAA